ncbi:MAG: hypothetical protein PWQ72_1213 [Pseudothermotoga sp.]|jgi:hypothetical protein|nr:hypothetical protein [Pseudothermotoga sp.]
MKYTTINIQGNLLSEEILQKIESGEAEGQKPIDFGYEPGANLRSEIEYAWSRIKLDWKHYSEKSINLPASDPYGTTLSRRWMELFLNTLGFNYTRQKSNLIGENNQGYAISHTADNLDDLPIHIVGFNEPDRPDKNTLDIRTSGGTTRLSPHATVQEYLNVTEHLFGIVTNGLQLRLIRDSGRLIKFTYIEFDLKRMLDEDKYSEFTLLFRLLHSSRFPHSRAEADQCLLEKYYQDSIEAGNRIRDGLSQAVKESLLSLGNGFLQHEGNDTLREKIKQGNLSSKEYYRQLLRIIYRLLFLMVTEERDLVYDPEDKTEQTQRFKNIYWQFYSIARLRKLSEIRYVFESQFNDMWQGLVQSFRLFEANSNGIKLGIQPLAGSLFSSIAILDLQTCLIGNKLLLECVRNMNEFRDENRNLVHINYRSLDVEELGSVYEGLLELHPVIENIEAENPAHINFSFHEGTERKTTGSYYTRSELVNELIKSALIPVIEERLKEHSGSREAQAKALLNLKVCDAAAGSGHMILAASRTIAWYLARVETGEDNPAPSIYRQCLREVIQHCIYAVDYNPDAVELCKLALWLEGHNSGKPLSFLDHKIRTGNSIVGVTDLSVLKKGIPVEAYNPSTGDDKQVCKWYKKLARKENKTYYQGSLYFDMSAEVPLEAKAFAGDYRQLENLPENSVEQTIEKANRFLKIRSNAQWFNDWNACNIWTAAYFHHYTQVDDPSAPTPAKLKTYLRTPTGIDGRVVGNATSLALEHKFFHWPLEFPDVFDKGGFDVMLGNPPWERIKLQQQEFFATRDVAIANAPNAAARDRLIQKLPQENPELYKEYEKAVHSADSTGKFLRESGRCVYTAVGDINTYSIFAELTSSLVNQKGRTGIIVPTGIATDDSNKAFFGAMVEQNRLVSLFDFENKEAIFPAVHRSYKFCLLTLSGSDIGKEKAQFGFFLTRIEHLQDKLRIFNLSKDDFLRLNPNTKTCPVFRTKVDAELTTKIYQKVPILINETTGENPWGVSYMRMFDMSNDSHLFRTRQQLELEGFKLWGNRMKRNDEVWLPLYEAKMIWHYDHRFGSYEGVESRTSTQITTPTLEQYQDPNYQILPWYWVREKEILDQIIKCDSKGNIMWKWQYKWFLGFRDITNNTNERTAIISIEPYSAVGNNNPLIFQKYGAVGSIIFQANLSTLIFDFPTRFKIAGTHMNFFYVNQLPIINFNSYDDRLKFQIISKASELIYCSWDIKSFADDVWKEATIELKQAIEQQWKENQTATGGNSWSPPEWCEIDPDGCPLPPFKWDEDRRAVLKAELDAIYAKLYGLTTEELRYILDPQDVYGSDFPGETFRVLKEKEIRQYGEYRTRRLVLEAWEKLHKNEG